MKNSDVERIQRILDGDDNAFSELVNKYKKPVHALVWRKLGDFHIAEEITQDTFLKAYQRLATLKKPQRFSSWLYVIAANNCSTWLRKKRLKMQSLEETSVAQLEKATYSGYVVEENERTAAETQREVVKKLLAKLQVNNRNRWEKISPEIPDSVINLVINENKLYIATKQRGIFHVSLQEKNN